MEAIAAFGLAASILQVVDFSGNILTSSKEIWRSGSTDRNVELGMTTTDLRRLSDELKDSCVPIKTGAQPLSETDQVCTDLSILQSKKDLDDLTWNQPGPHSLG